MIELKEVKKIYQMGDQTLCALNGVSLSIEAGEFVSLMGPSGSGKSTLMHILGLLDVPTAGDYFIRGKKVSHLDEDELAILRRNEIGFIFQQFNLLSRMNAVENVALPLLYSENKLDFEKSKKFLTQVGLGARLKHRPNELSGGQQQRVAIARSLVNFPKIILADEPTGNLDSVSEKEILVILKELNSKGITIVIVTHEEEVAQQTRRIIRMRDGLVHSDEVISRVNSKRHSVPSVEKENINIKTSLWSSLGVHFLQGLKILSANKVRTGLSMLGILIGVAAVVTMMALGNGAQKAMEAQLSSLGSNLLVLRPGPIKTGGVTKDSGASARFTLEDVLSLQEIPTIKEAAPYISGKAQVTYLNKNWATDLLGVSPSYVRIHASYPEIGRFFTDEENQKRARVAVLGVTLVRELFGDQNPIGETVKINRVNFLVIGILPEKGGSWEDKDDRVVVPVLTTMHRLLGKNYVDYIDIEVSSLDEMENTQNSILELMFKRHKVPHSQRQNFFKIRNMADIQATLTENNHTMALLLASIAAISLLVGGIGIMNIMLVSVTERTREIGLRKAIGAMRKDILFQFLVEAVVVSVVGGVIGIILGGVSTSVLAYFTGWATAISLSSVCLAFVFSASIGIIFGIYPAKKASLLNPIDALRYE